MEKIKYYLKVYIDSSYFSQKKEAFCCYYFFGLLDDDVKGNFFFSIGAVNNSALSEYLGVEKTLEKIDKYLHKRSISHSRVEIDVFTDLQVLPRQYKKWIPPPMNQRMIDSFSRICKILSKFKKAEIFWVQRSENPAGKLLEKNLKDRKIKDIEIKRSTVSFKDVMNL
ncbi:MAG: hypothetical protein GYA61_06755 [Spirochaetales bacterium]|jgi:ribonuclease HI|nr:hypothetical protein [Exilispira sp.]NMC67908.1 hypothetical protein [Spirochaetales bacterium]